MFGLTSEVQIGIEITEQRILLAEVRKKGGQYVVQHLVQAAIPSEVMEEGKIKQVDTLSGLLQGLLRELKIKSTRAHLVVASQFVVIRQLQLPDLPKAKLRKVIDFELQNSSIHLPFDNPIYDFVKLEGQPVETQSEPPLEVQRGEGEIAETATEETNKAPEVDVALIASSHAAIDPIVAVAKQAGLKPVSVDIRALSLSRAYRKLGHPMEGRTTMFVDIAEDWADIHIFHGRTLKFTRNVPMSLDTYCIDREISKPMHVLGILEYFQSNTDYRSFTNDLAYEMERSVNFFRYTLNNRDASLQNIVLSGLLPTTGVLQSYLQDRFPETKVTAMPFTDLQFAEGMEHKRDFLHEYSVAIGLALREVK